MTNTIDYKTAIYDKAIILCELIEGGAENDIIAMTVKMLAIDYLQFCKQVGINPVKPMDPKTIEEAEAASGRIAEAVVNAIKVNGMDMDSHGVDKGKLN